MTSKKPVITSAVLTIVLLIFVALLFVLLQMLAVNGATERQALSALGFSLGCQGIVIILLAILAARSTHFLITKVNWDSILAVVATVIPAVIIGGTISFVSMILAIPLAGIR